MARLVCSPIFCAIRDGDIEELRKLLRKRKRVDVRDHFGFSSLHAAVLRNRRDMVEVLLNHPDTDVNCRNYEGYTSLWCACRLPDLDLTMARGILNHGGDANIPDKRGVTPLHLACKRGSLGLVQLLIRHQADVNIRMADGRTPLHYAIRGDWPEIMKCLLAHRADADATIGDGLSLLMFTLQRRSRRAGLLVPYTRNLDARDISGQTALLLAIRSANWSVARTLLAHGASLTAHTCKKTALQIAITCADYEMFKLVWRHTDPRTVSNSNHFLRHISKYCRLPGHYKYYELVLNTPGVDLHLDRMPALFCDVFFCGPPPVADLDAAKRQYLNVVGWLLDRGAYLKSMDVVQVLWYFKGCPYTAELWRMIFAKSTPNITQQAVAKAVQYESYEVALLFATYCLYLKPENVTSFRVWSDERFWRRWLALFTPSSRYRRRVTQHARYAISGYAASILNATNRVRSLVELSRNAVRRGMQSSCTTTHDFLAALAEWPIPSDYKDIIRLRVPVNRHLLED